MSNDVLRVILSKTCFFAGSLKKAGAEITLTSWEQFSPKYMEAKDDFPAGWKKHIDDKATRHKVNDDHNDAMTALAKDNKELNDKVNELMKAIQAMADKQIEDPNKEEAEKEAKDEQPKTAKGKK